MTNKEYGWPSVGNFLNIPASSSSLQPNVLLSITP